MKKINISTIRIDGGTQSRVEINTEAVAEYAEAIKDGIEFPAVVVFNDGAECWLADGFHRYHAHKSASKVSILADVRSGTVRDAILYSMGANGTHGLRRTNADKRKSVSAMFADSEWSQWSDRKISEACGVSNTFVSNLRKPPKVSTVDTPATPKRAHAVESDSTQRTGKVESDSNPAVQKQPKRTLNLPDEQPSDDDQLNEAQHTITDLAAENERLSDRLAVEAMDASEDEKTAASQTIAELRERVRCLEVEVGALKASRDTYMRESNERMKQITYWRKQAEKAAA